jgi:hypothetical protein
VDFQVHVVGGDAGDARGDIFTAHGFDHQHQVLVIAAAHGREEGSEFRFNETAVERELAAFEHLGLRQGRRVAGRMPRLAWAASAAPGWAAGESPCEAEGIGAAGAAGASSGSSSSSPSRDGNRVLRQRKTIGPTIGATAATPQTIPAGYARITEIS